MSCPDLRTLSRVGTPDADPAVVEHVLDCDSCWLDWQIQQGARYLRDPAVKAAGDVNDRVVARVLLRARHRSEAPASWRDASLFGVLVAISVLAFVLTAPSVAAAAIPMGPAVAYAVAAGASAMFRSRQRDEDRLVADH